MPETRYAEALQRQRCKACWNADGFDFYVPDAVWDAVVPAALRNHVVCLHCFDDFACEKHLDYLHHLSEDLYFAGDWTALVLRIERRATAPVSEEKPDAG